MYVKNYFMMPSNKKLNETVMSTKTLHKNGNPL